MYLLSALLFALSANIDSFIIGISCGIRKSKISIPQILLISLITLCGTVAALAAGGELLCLFPLPYAEYTGKFILIIFGKCSIIRKFLIKVIKYFCDMTYLNFILILFTCYICFFAIYI